MVHSGTHHSRARLTRTPNTPTCGFVNQRNLAVFNITKPCTHVFFSSDVPHAFPHAASVTRMANQVIFTDDADQAAMPAIEQVYPSSLSKLCLYHINQNIRKHGGGLGEGVLAAVVGKFHAAAYAQTEEVNIRDSDVKCLFDVREIPREQYG